MKPPSRDIKSRTAWYESSIFNIHFDHHANRDSPVGMECDPAKIKRLLQLSRPTMVQYQSKGHPGYATYPTKVGVQAPNLKKDVLRTYRDLTCDLGIRLSIYYSSLVDQLQAKLHPEWLRQRPDSKPQQVPGVAGGLALCCNSGYIDKVHLPMLHELTEWYDPDAFWLDGGTPSVVPCYCSVCQDKFGQLTGEEPPVKTDDHGWSLWAKFQRDSYINYQRRCVETIRAIKPDCLFSDNWAFSLHQPDDVPDYIDWLTCDVTPIHGARHASFEARFLQWRKRPYDIMTWNCVYDRQPGHRAHYKSTQHLLQEGAVILANGARWFVWDNPTDSDDLIEHAHLQMQELAQFARDRKDLALKTKSLPWVAVLNGQSSHYAQGQGMFEYQGPTYSALRGLSAILNEESIHFDILNEETLCRRGHMYRLIVLAAQNPLNWKVAEMLRRYVHDGGNLLIIGKTGLTKADDGHERFLLEDVIGALYVKETGLHWLPIQAEKVGGEKLSGFTATSFASSHCIQVEPSTARVLLKFWNTPQAEKNSCELPVMLENHFGKGICWYLATEATREYDEQRYPPLRTWLGDLIRKSAPSLVTIEGGKQVEVTAREAQGRWIVHLVNLWTGKELHGFSWGWGHPDYYVEEVPVRGPLTVRLDCPQRPDKVILEPGSGDVEWRWDNGIVTAKIPELHIHVALVVCWEEQHT